MLLQRPNKISRSGLTIFSDMGLLFQDNRIDDLIKHETGLFLSLSSLKYCNRMKIFCCYDLKDFEFLAEYLKQMLIDNHKEITE
jgi:hypothetical protein